MSYLCRKLPAQAASAVVTGIATCRWAVGVLIFEMVSGHPPFYDEDRVRMFKNICSVRYTCPPTFSRVSPHTGALTALYCMPCGMCRIGHAC